MKAIIKKNIKIKMILDYFQKILKLKNLKAKNISKI